MTATVDVTCDVAPACCSWFRTAASAIPPSLPPGRASCIGTATAVADTQAGADGTRVRNGATGARPAARAAAGTGGSATARSGHAASSGEPGGDGRLQAAVGSASVTDRRAPIEFGTIVIRTSRRWAGRARPTTRNAAPSAPPRTRPRARKAISDGLTVLPCDPGIGPAVPRQRSCAQGARQPFRNGISRARTGQGDPRAWFPGEPHGRSARPSGDPRPAPNGQLVPSAVHGWSRLGTFPASAADLPSACRRLPSPPQ